MLRVKIIYMEILTEIWGYLLPVLVAAVAGIVVGLEREFRDRSAGFRTMVLVAVGSATFVITTPLLVEVGVDGTYIIPMVIVSIGLLSASVILKLGANSNGLTTAASIWLVALLGLISATGQYLLVALITLLVLVIVWTFPFLEKVVGKRTSTVQIDVTIKNKDEVEDEVLDILDELKIKVIDITRSRIDASERTVHITMKLTTQQRKDLSEIIVNEKSILKFSV